MLDLKKEIEKCNYACPDCQTAETSTDTSDVPQPSCRQTAAHALTIVRDGVITGEGPTTRAVSIFPARSMPTMPPGARAS